VFAPRATEQTWVPRELDGDFLNRRPPEPWAQGDPADSLYRAAREALNRGEYRRAAQSFNELTRRYPNSVYAYVSSYWEAFSRYRIGTTDELKAADRALQQLAGRSAPSGRDEIDVNGLRARIRGALALRGDVGAGDYVDNAARQAGSSCDRDDLMVRVEALNALSQMDAAAALPILRRVLERKDECLVELRRRAIFMLARRGDNEATTLLIASAKSDPSIEVRTEAIGYLPRMPGEAGMTALEEVLRTADDERVQRAAVRALMASDSPRARASLRSLIEVRDAPDALRVQAIEAFSKERSTPEDAAYLRSLYGRIENERVRNAIIGALARIGGRENQDWLLGLVRNTNETSQLRSSALQRLTRSDIPVADLARMYDAADSRSMREQVISALASRTQPEATDKLIEIAKNSTDPDMRRLAINYLSRKNDPRTTKLLMELIEK
jgi:HEAT repeat protein